jgi:hypothetical protein
VISFFAPKPWSLSQTILNFNRQMKPWELRGGAVVYSAPLQGAVIHRLRPLEADEISKHLKLVRDEYKNVFTLPLMMAFIGLESRFDPACENRNGKLIAGRTVASTRLEDYDRMDVGNWDMGLCQLKLRYVQADPRTNCPSLSAAKDYAMSIPDAIEQKTRILIDNWLAAKKFLASNPEYLGVDSKMLGIEMYQAGRTGAIAKLKASTPFTYAPKVAVLEQQFAARLGIASVFAKKAG